MKHIYLKKLLLLLLLMTGATASAYNAYIDGIYYNLNTTMKTAEVTAKSKSYYSGDIKIPSSVTYNQVEYVVNSIGSKAFYYCTGLTSVTIPSSVTSIGEWAFSSCSGLTSVTIPNSVTSIGNYAFNGCRNLKSITFNDSLEFIGKYAFEDCTSLTSIIFPNSVKHIADNAFSGCENLENIVLPDNVNLYPESFEKCGIKELILKNGIRINSLYYGVYAGGVPLPGTFANCKKLEYAYIDCRNADENKLFDGCDKLERIVIGPNGSFYDYLKCSDMPSLKSIDVEPGNSSSLFSDDGVVYQNKKVNENEEIWLRAVPNAKEVVNIIDGVNGIGEYAFYGCRKMTSAKIPSSVYSIDRSAFGNCGLKSIEIPNSVTDMGSSVFKGDTIDVYLYGCPSIRFSGYYHPFDGMRPGSRLFSFSYVKAPKYRLIKSNDMPQLVPFDEPIVEIHPSSITIKEIKLSNIDDTLLDYYLEGTESTSKTGLEPDTENGVFYYMKTEKNGIAEGYYSFKTPALTLTTLQPKVISPGNVIVAAQSNLKEEEENVGFEWRRTDWTDDFPSNSGAAYLYDGQMEGYIRNLNTDKLWKYRPYYESASGTRYYGEWVGLDPTNTSYFEPTVHTYAQVNVQGNTASVRGYAMRGSDNTAEQGFKYWKSTASARAMAPGIPSNAETVTATGVVMEASLTNLDYESTYCYVAFVKTSEGETFYGDQRQFTTGVDPDGIEGTIADKGDVKPVAFYDLNGRRLQTPQPGLVIVRMSDGSVRKVMKK